VRIERYGHWAVGWIEEIYVKPDTNEYNMACEIEAALETYPILDEEDYCAEEMNEANDVWRNCYTWKNRIDYVRKRSHQFKFNNLADVIKCIRGLYFAGSVSDLLN
jgi:hypothetical protein